MTAALARIATNPHELDFIEDPAARIIEACERAKEWLALATDTDDIERIVETKAQAEAIRVYSVQKQLGKDSELSAQEVVRRAERGIGVAIRRGQESGALLERGQTVRRPGPGHVGDDVTNMTIPEGTFSNSHERVATYAVTDGVSDEAFEAVLTDAKAEKNLSRANVIRKARVTKLGAPDVAAEIVALAATGHDTRGIAKRLGISEERVYELAHGYDIAIPADSITKRTRRLDSDRVVNQIVLDADALVAAVNLVQFADLDRTRITEWANSLSESMRALSKFAKQLKELAQP